MSVPQTERMADIHIDDYRKVIGDQLIDELYQLGKADQQNRWMLSLEITIVLLFIIDLVVLFMGLKK